MPRNLSDSDLEQQIEMQADQYIPFPMEEVSYDFQVLGPSEKDPDMRDVLLVASRSENVEQRVAAVNASGLVAKLVDVEAFALENACKLLTHQMPDGGMDRRSPSSTSARARRPSACCATSSSCTRATLPSAASS
jgi:type IV pilus assembly protein PilM